MRKRAKLSDATKQKIREAMLRIGHLPPSQLNKVRSEESRSRMSKSKLGKKHSDGTRKKMSENRKGSKNAFYHKVHSKHTKEKMSLARKSFFAKGNKPTNYIFDRSKLAKRQKRNDSMYVEWRRSVQCRDKWKCRLANEKCEGKIVVHHIKPWHKYPTLRYKIKNGIVLCRFHHPRSRDEEIKLQPILQDLVAI